MKPTGKAAKPVILRGLDALPEHGSVKFSFKIGDFPAEGFVIRIGGQLKAFVNRCSHAGTTLDFGDNEFFTEDGRWLHCKTHGALYEPSDGSCAGGPCSGKGLEPMVLTRKANGDYIVKAASEGTS